MAQIYEMLGDVYVYTVMRNAIKSLGLDPDNLPGFGLNAACVSKVTAALNLLDKIGGGPVGRPVEWYRDIATAEDISRWWHFVCEQAYAEGGRFGKTPSGALMGSCVSQAVTSCVTGIAAKKTGPLFVVEDDSLIEALMRTRIEGVSDDLTMRYPCMDFGFTHPVYLPGAVEPLVGMSVSNLDTPAYQQEIREIFYGFFEGGGNVHLQDYLFLNAQMGGKSPVHFVERLGKGTSLDEPRFESQHDSLLLSCPTVNQDDDLPRWLRSMTHLAVALLMYIQTMPEKIVTPGSPQKAPSGVPGKLASRMKKRKKRIRLRRKGLLRKLRKPLRRQ